MSWWPALGERVRYRSSCVDIDIEGEVREVLPPEPGDLGTWELYEVRGDDGLNYYAELQELEALGDD